MKRWICLFLALLLALSGCTLSAQGFRDPVTFYYLREQYRYGDADGVIAGEQRESAGHAGDLSYLMSLYFMGPSEEELVSPIPRGVQLQAVILEDHTATLVLSDTTRVLTDSEFSLTAACLAMTTMEITPVTKVIIRSADRAATITRDNLTLFDDSAAVAATEETQ